jgi:hypothetical protein
VRLATRWGFLKNRERGERVTRANKSTKNPHVGTVHHGGESLNPCGSRRWRGQDVHWSSKGVDALQFGPSEGVGRW